MNPILLPLRRLSYFLACVFWAFPAAWSQTYNVNNNSQSGAGSLPDAIMQANLGNVNVININVGLIALSSQQFLYADVAINGNGVVIDMANSDRAFFLAGGNIAISNLTILNGKAVGGNGIYGGGGGAGLGGAIFVANGPFITNVLSKSANVTLSQISFLSNQAVGGTSGPNDTFMGGGGGGMGGNGGSDYNLALGSNGGGGGGGFGVGANGGASDPDSPGNGTAGAFLPTINSPLIGGGSGATDDSGHAGGTGGLNGGGGGGANASQFGGYSPGGGGGVGGGNATFGAFSVGGYGGFGGGGGGSGASGLLIGGAGGFGGGGGGGGGPGGFGGGAGTDGSGIFFLGGFGGGDAQSVSEFDATHGGGGLGAGGALFVMLGTNVTLVDSIFNSNSVTPGAAGNADSHGGSAIGANIFLGANTTFTVSSGNTTTLSGLGGAGNTSDPNVSGHANDPNAQGGIIKEGAGTLVLQGANYYTGSSVVNNGTLEIAGTSTTRGYAVGANGTLSLTGNLSNVGPIVLQGGNVNLSGNDLVVLGPTVVQGGNFTFSGQNDGVAQMTINAGIVSFQGTGTLQQVAVNGGLLDIGAGAQNLQGNITVSGGEMQVDGQFNLSANNLITVGGNGTVSGTGRFQNLALNPGGVLAPGSDGAGQLTGNTLNWSAGGLLDIANLGTNGTVLQVDNFHASNGGTFVVRFTNLGDAQAGQMYSLVNFLGTNFLASNFDYTSADHGLTGAFVLDASTLRFQVITVPEAGNFAWVAGLLSGLAALTRACGRGSRTKAQLAKQDTGLVKDA